MPTKNISYKAVVIGFLLDVIGSTILGILVGIALAAYSISQGTDPHDFNLTSNPAFLGSMLPLGLLFTMFGGFTAALIAPRAKLFNAALVGAAGVVMALPLCFSYPLWYNAIAFVLAIPAASLGGLVGEMIRPEKPVPPETTPA